MIRTDRLLPLLIALGLAAPAVAVEVPAVLDADATWTAADSPYRVSADAELLAGVTLTLEPGVVVELADGVSLTIRGSLIARGSEAAPITFTGADDGDGPARWGSLVIHATAPPATYTDVDDYAGGSILEHCTLEHATRALDLQGASPYVHACTFRDNELAEPAAEPGGAALHVVDGAAPRVRGCLFEDNAVGIAGWGGAIYAARSAAVLQDNVFVGNESSYGGALATVEVYAPIVGNVFESNVSGWEGGAISLYSSSPVLLANEVRDNSAVADGGGIHVCVDCRPHAAPSMLDNRVENNTSAFTPAAGVGMAYVRRFTANALTGNVLDETWASDLGWFNARLEAFPDWVTHPDVSGNWWGVTDPDYIAETIHDGDDEDGLGAVTYLPALDADTVAPTLRGVPASRQLMYDGAAAQLAIHLTLYNPGPARDVEVVVALQYDDGGRLLHRGGLPGLAGPLADGEHAYTVSMPENAVWFGALVDHPGADCSQPAGGAWHVALFDADSGERLDDVSTIRFALGRTEDEADAE